MKGAGTVLGLLAALAWAAPLAASDESFPRRVAPSARLELKTARGQPPIDAIWASRGSVSEAGWLEDREARKRLQVVSFPIDWWRWSEVEVHFTPAFDGEVELSLTGPWAQTEDGQLLRQEVLWEVPEGRMPGVFQTTATSGTSGANAGDALPEPWESPWRPYPALGEWPPRQAGQVASWHGRPLVRKLAVRAGRELTLAFRARAATPPGFREPRRLGSATPAHEAAATLKRGVNLGNGWEAPPGTWGRTFTAADIDRIAGQGFDHLRIPVGWHHYLDEKGIDPEFRAELEPVLRRAIERGLVVLLDWHHHEELVRDPARHRDGFIRGWQRLGQHFHDWPRDRLYFELLNEPHAPLDHEVLNELYRDTIRAIREVDERRILVVEPSSWGTTPALGRLRLDDAEQRVIVSFHCYDPFEFTHQGADWVDLGKLDGVVFPGPPAGGFEPDAGLMERDGFPAWLRAYRSQPAARNPVSPRAFEDHLDRAAAWSREFGRPVHLGEFGAYGTADDASRQRYAAAIRRACEDRDIPWCWWEWDAGFGYWDREGGQPRFREALFGR